MKSAINGKKVMKIIGVLLIIVIAAVLISKTIGQPGNSKGNETVGSAECGADSDCVKAQCCHAASCVAKDKAPQCSDIMCTEECQDGTMDCGHGSCSCVQGKCSAVFK